MLALFTHATFQVLLRSLLFAHTAYKSYPDSWFNEGKWDRMGLWLDTITTYPVDKIDTSNVSGVDDWIEQVADTGYYISCSSGTNGKCSMLPATAEDRRFYQQSYMANFEWATNLPRANDHIYVMITPVAQSYRTEDTQQSIQTAFAFEAVRIAISKAAVSTMIASHAYRNRRRLRGSIDMRR